MQLIFIKLVLIAIVKQFYSNFSEETRPAFLRLSVRTYVYNSNLCLAYTQYYKLYMKDLYQNPLEHSLTYVWRRFWAYKIDKKMTLICQNSVGDAKSAYARGMWEESSQLSVSCGYTKLIYIILNFYSAIYMHAVHA